MSQNSGTYSLRKLSPLLKCLLRTSSFAVVLNTDNPSTSNRIMPEPYVGRPTMVSSSFTIAAELSDHSGQTFSGVENVPVDARKQCPCTYCGQKHAKVLLAVLCCLFA